MGWRHPVDETGRRAWVLWPRCKTLPVEEFCTDRRKAIDADVKFTGRRIVRNPNLPITDLSTHVVMTDGEVKALVTDGTVSRLMMEAAEAGCAAARTEGKAACAVVAAREYSHGSPNCFDRWGGQAGSAWCAPAGQSGRL